MVVEYRDRLMRFGVGVYRGRAWRHVLVVDGWGIIDDIVRDLQEEVVVSLCPDGQKGREEPGPESHGGDSVRVVLSQVSRWCLRFVPKSVPPQAIKNCGAAFQRFFKKQGRYPRFQKKGVRDSARFDNGPGTFAF